MLRVRVCGQLRVEADGRSLPDALFGGRQGRLVLAYLVCRRAQAVRKEELAELLWGDHLPDSWSASLSAVISRLRRLLTEAGLDGSAALAAIAGGYQLVLPADTSVDLDELTAAVDAAEAAAASDVHQAVEAATIAESIAAHGFLTDDCDWVDRQRDLVRQLRVRAALARSEAHLYAGAAVRAVEAARDALALDESRESSFRQLMRALAAAGERGEALRVWERCRTTLVEALGVDPSPETEAVYLRVLGAGPGSEPTTTALPSGVVTFLLTDIVESSALWDSAPDAMAVALERHDALMAEVVTAHGGTLLKSKLEGDATVSVFARASDGAAAALGLLDAVAREPWPAGVQPRVRMAMHTGEAFERGGDYFGPALNRAARLRALAGAGQVLLSQAVIEVVRDHLPAGAELRDLGYRELRGLSRGENVYVLTKATAESLADPRAPGGDASMLIPPTLPDALACSGPFVGRRNELTRLVDLWDRATEASQGAVFIGGEPGVGKSRLAAEVAGHAHSGGAIVLYGRCDEDLAVPLQPFIEALRSVVPALGPTRVRSVRGVDELARLIPELAEELGDRSPAVRADPDTERLALFDAVANMVRIASAEVPVLFVLDDLHWAGKTTLSLLRHLLREAKDARLLVVGTYRDTELARTHPLAETLADLRRGADAIRISLGGLAVEDIDAYLAAVGIDDRALGRELAEVTSGNPFFLIEVLRHVEETGGAWTPGSLPEGVREATGRRLSRLSEATNRALLVAAVAGTRFDLALIEQVEASDLVDVIAEACHAGLVVEEPGVVGRFRFAHALVRQVLLAELVTVKRVRLHKQIAELLEAAPVGDDPDGRLADLAYHWSECASLAGAAKAVDACRRAADRAVERLAYEEAADLYGMALQVLDASDDADSETRAALHLARCDACLTAGDVAAARYAIDALELIAQGSERLAAWYTTYEGQLAVLSEPDRLTEIVQSIAAAANAMRAISDLRGEARAHYVHASALERLGQIGAAERSLDAALAAARGADDRQLADAILAEAPYAALWGPSTVPRASGRCLDVIRVLRISDGAPAVEAVALRCQAMLEALRGRRDAARRMIESARQTDERLGLTHRQLETQVAAGLIELLDGDGAEAEVLLRAAYEGLRERGLGGEAAQAAAFLGRSLLLQNRIDEADQAGAEAEALAGSDLKAAIAWRGVRAETAARRGDAARALALAREAVDLAAPTDALLLVADARLALATVLRATGDESGADAEARCALEAYEAKGATALAARVRDATPAAAAPPADTSTARRRAEAAAMTSAARPPNAAMTAMIHFQEAFNRGDFEAMEALRHPQGRFVDRRSLIQAENRGNAVAVSASFALAYETGVRYEPPELLVARGNRTVLTRWEFHAAGSEWSLLLVVRVDDAGRLTDFVAFDVGDRRAANQELERIAPAEEEHDTSAWRAACRSAAATNAHDWDALIATLAPGYQRLDRRPVVRRAAIDPLDEDRTLFSLDDWAMERTAIELYGDRRVLCRDVVWFRDGAVADAEVESIEVIEVDDAGHIVRQVAFGPDDLDAARNELRAGAPETPPVPTAVVEPNAAWRACGRLEAANNERDWEQLVACFSEDFSKHDRRMLLDQHGDDALSSFRAGFDLDQFRGAYRLVAVRGEHLALIEQRAVFRDGWSGPSEVQTLSVIEADDDGHITTQVVFDPTALTEALAELDARYTARVSPPRFANAAWRCIADEAVDLVGTRGDRLALVRTRTGLLLVEVDAEGTKVATEAFGGDNIDAALDALDHRHAAISPIVRFAHRWGELISRREWAGLADLLTPTCVIDDRRPTRFGVVQGRDAIIDMYRVFAGTVDEVRVRNWHIREARRGVWLTVGGEVGVAAGAHFENSLVAISWLDEDGRSLRHEFYDLDQLDEAWARFEKTPAAVADPFRNAVDCTAERFTRAWAAKDWNGVADCFAPDFRSENRRSLTRNLVPDVTLDGLHLLLDESESGAWEVERLATRGDRLALHRHTYRYRTSVAGPSEMSWLAVIGEDDAGRHSLFVAFDLDAVDSAYDELDERYAQTEAAPFGQVWARVREETQAHNDGRGPLRLSDGCTLHDHRVGGWGEISAKQWADSVRQIFALSPDARLRVSHVVELNRRSALLVVTWSGVNIEGSEWELRQITLLEFDAAALVVRGDVYSESQLDQARARFDDVAAAAVDPFRNAVDATVQRVKRAWEAHAWNAVANCFAPDFRWDNRRSLTPLGSEQGNSLDMVRWLFYEAESGAWELERLATRGDKLALYRHTYRYRTPSTGPAESSWLLVIENDDFGRHAAVVVFDSHALDTAYEELDERYACGEAAPFTRAWATSRQLMTTYNDRTLDRWPLEEGYTIEYHAQASFGQLDGRRFAASQTTLNELSPDVRSRIDHVLGLTDQAIITVVTTEGVDREGGPWQATRVVVSRTDSSGRPLHSDLYDLDQLDEARQRYTELVAETAVDPL